MADLKDNGTNLTAQKIFNWASLIVAVLALIVPTILSIRAEQSKELTLEHIRTQNLLNSEAPRSPSLKIFRDGVEVSKPWLLSLRVENSGSVPIQKSEVEQPLTLRFQKSKIVQSEVSAQAPANLDISLLKSKDRELVAIHSLLNPKDSFLIDVVLDGEQEFPLVLSRISGIKTVTVNRESGAEKSVAAPLGRLPKPVRAMILIVVFGLFAVLAIASLLLFADAFKRIVRTSRPAELARPSKLGEKLTFQIWRSVGDLPVADEFIQSTLSGFLTTLDPHALLDRQVIRGKLLEEISQVGVNYPEDQIDYVVERLETRVREVLHLSLARHYRIHAPIKLDEALADEFGKNPIGNRDLPEFLKDCDGMFDRLLDHYVEEEHKRPWTQKLSWSDFWGGLVTAGVTTALGLVLFSTYRLFIPQ